MALRKIGVSGTSLKYQDYSGNWRAEEGTLTGGSGTAKELWLKGDHIYYNDATGATRSLPFETSTAIISGNFIIKGDWVTYKTYGGDTRKWHTDTPHSDIHNDTYIDSHTNGYADTHTDIPYYDTHANISHLNDGHEDVHTDIPYWYDSGMTWARAHEDIPYNDSHYNGHVNAGYVDHHTNTGHDDAHANEGTDAYSDYTHTDGYHYDSTIPHTVAVNYTDATLYTDVAAVDRPPIV